MSGFTRFFLVVTGAVFALIGLNTFRDPAAAMQLIELPVNSVSALNEIRANYGGMQLGMGLFFMYGAFAAALTRPALLVLAVYTGGLVAGRLVGIALDGLPNAAVQGFLAIETLSAVLALILLRLKPATD